ncbi:MAG: hypothetical protein P4L99_00365 [Chthoniobacter sp.]|nr:hypothetical protein [Chthoniobacter sp.]
MTNLILGQAYNYTFEQLAPFVISLRQTGYAGEVVLFVNRVDEETKRQLSAHQIQLREFHYRGPEVRNSAYVAWPYLRWLRHLPVPFAVKKAILRPLVNVPWVRMILYYDFLTNPQGRYGQVMLTDVRDVIFQADPFARETGPGLRAFLEDESMRIGNSQANIQWMTELFGKDVLERLGELPISCSGTTIGDAESVRNYLRAFIEAAFTVRSTRLNGGDQGIHNYLVHGALRPTTALLRNGEAEVLTMGYLAREGELAMNADGRLVDVGGRIFNVLHQYDRHPELADKIVQRYLSSARS